LRRANSNRAGKSSLKRHSLTWPVTLSTNMIGSSRQNSAATWRQAPHGAAPPSLAITSRSNWVSPAATAAVNATRSAHCVRP